MIRAGRLQRRQLCSSWTLSRRQLHVLSAVRAPIAQSRSLKSLLPRPLPYVASRLLPAHSAPNRMARRWFLELPSKRLKHVERRTVPFSAEQVFDVVADVDKVGYWLNIAFNAYALPLLLAHSTSNSCLSVRNRV